MSPITPQRFIEILVDAKNVKLWHTTLNKYFDCNGIEYNDPYWNATLLTINRKLTCLRLDYCYESQPETPLDELDGIISKWGCTSEDWKYFDLITDWRKKYNSQLKEMK